ncbi:MAG: choice-of-anchor L domain-containing protein [Thermoleophilaceae bacterium]
MNAACWRGRTGLGIALLAFMVFGGIGIAVAAKSKITAKQGKIIAERGQESRQRATKLARTVVRRKYVRTAAFAARPPYGRIAGRSTKRLAGFPRSGKSFLILSTGNVLLADNKNFSGSSGQRAGGPPIRGARDVTIFRFNMRVPRGRNCVSFRFRFLTEEFPEFINEEFNDAFIAEMDETTWGAASLGDPTITAPRNFAFDSKGNPITVNGAGDATVTAKNARGTTYDGATRILRASTKVSAGKHRLYLSIFDQGDRQFDSAVFVDRLTFSRNPKCKPGAARDK